MNSFEDGNSAGAVYVAEELIVMYFVCFEAEFCSAQDPGRTQVGQVRGFVLLYRSRRVRVVERKGVEGSRRKS